MYGDAQSARPWVFVDPAGRTSPAITTP